MKLHQTIVCGLAESHFFFSICEDGEAPKWDFNYDNYENDPTPSILVLGAYKHPSTGNNLVGGINLNYLSKPDRDDLARILPQLMKANDLYHRYHLGARLLPGIFNKFYRTYNAAHIRGVTADVFYPKYGMLKTTQDFIKKKLAGVFKSKEQRAQDAEPKFPQDLGSMKDTLDQTVAQMGLQVGKIDKGQPETPEMQAARTNFKRFQADRAKSLMGIEKQEDQPVIQANNQFQATQLQKGAATPQQVSPQAVTQAAQQFQAAPIQQQEPPPTPQQMGNIIKRERAENESELMDPKNSLDLDGDGLADDQQPVRESLLYYYDQNLKHYIVEDLEEAIGCM